MSKHFGSAIPFCFTDCNKPLLHWFKMSAPLLGRYTMPMALQYLGISNKVWASPSQLHSVAPPGLHAGTPVTNTMSSGFS